MAAKRTAVQTTILFQLKVSQLSDPFLSLRYSNKIFFTALGNPDESFMNPIHIDIEVINYLRSGERRYIFPLFYIHVFYIRYAGVYQVTRYTGVCFILFVTRITCSFFV